MTLDSVTDSAVSETEDNFRFGKQTRLYLLKICFNCKNSKHVPSFYHFVNIIVSDPLQTYIFSQNSQLFIVRKKSIRLPFQEVTFRSVHALEARSAIFPPKCMTLTRRSTVFNKAYRNATC